MSTVRVLGHHIQARVLLLGVLQAVLAVASIYATVALRNWYLPQVSKAAVLSAAPIVTFVFVLMANLLAVGLYRVRLRESAPQIVSRIVIAFGLTIITMAAIAAFLPALYLGPSIFAFAIVAAFLVIVVTHLIFFALVDENVMKRRILFYGAGHNAASMLSKLRRRSDQRLFELMGCVQLPNEMQAVDETRLVELNTGLSNYVRENDIDEVVVAMDDRRGGFPTAELLACRLAGVDVTNMLNFYERHTGMIKCDLLQPGDLIFADGFNQGPLRRASKRALDVMAAVMLLVPGLPLVLLAALAIKLEDGLRAPVFYRQTRVGESGRDFRIYKMRSMRVDAEKPGKAQWASRDDDRVTRVGAVMRKYRIDELPQLFNVLQGSMGFVGPRPERPEFVLELAEALPFYNVRHRVKPGITGWAQLCYPYGSSMDDALQKLQYDLYYVKNGGVFLDLVIIIGTVEVILFRTGAR